MLDYEWENEKESLNKEKFRKGLSAALEKKLNKKYPPSSRIDDVFKGNDISFITNSDGEPVTLYIGKRREDGNISGELYSRRIKKRENGLITDSHWDNQGKVSGKIKK